MMNPCQGHAAESARDEHMKEAERLLAKHEQAAGLCRYADCQTTRAALLAHIQRGAVPEGWQVVPSADQLWNNDEVMALNAELGLTMDQLSRLASAITRIAHPADWRERFSQAVYDDLAAADNQDFPLEEYPARILKVLGAVIGREIKPAPAEVPMPDDDIMRDALEHLAGLDTHDVNLRDNPKAYEVLERLVRTYGAACRAAGEAAGYVRGLRDAVRDAERYRWLRRHFAIVGTDNGAVFHALNLPTPTHIAPDAAIELDASIDAALREEVK